MGLRRRLQAAGRAFRSETYTRVSEYTTDVNEPLTFTSDLVTGEFTDKNNWRNLLKVAWEDPIANRICVTLSKNVFDDWFVIRKSSREEDADDDETLPEHEMNEQIQEELERMQAKYHATQALIGMRIFGRSFLIFDYNLHKDEYETGYQVATLDVFTEENTTIPQEAYDLKTGVPTFIEVSPSGHSGEKDKIPWEDVQLWNVDPVGRSIAGYSAMFPVWDLLTYLREDIDAVIWAIKKFGLGVWLWLIKGGMDETVKAALEGTLKNMSGRRAVVAEEDTVGSVEWKGPPAGSISGVIEASDFILGMISSGSSIPKDIFTGVSAGAITGSEVNNKALYATISKIQSDITPYMLEMIARMGYDIADMVIDWNVRYATDELEQAQIRLLLAQAQQLEMQAERGTDFQIGLTTGEDVEQNQNQTGVQS